MDYFFHVLVSFHAESVTGFSGMEGFDWRSASWASFVQSSQAMIHKLGFYLSSQPPNPVTFSASMSRLILHNFYILRQQQRRNSVEEFPHFN